MNLSVTTIWVRFRWRVLLVCVRFLQPWWTSCNVVLTLSFKVFLPPHILYRTQIRKNRCDSYKKRRPCVLSNISIMTISVGLHVAVNNPGLGSLVWFQQYRAIERFCAEGSNKRSDRGDSSDDIQFLLTVLSERHFRIFANRLTLSIFSSQQWVRGPHKWISLGQGWATPGTRAELGTRTLLSSTWARPRKQDPPSSNGKVNNSQVAVLSDETRCPFLHFRLLTIRYLI